MDEGSHSCVYFAMFGAFILHILCGCCSHEHCIWPLKWSAVLGLLVTFTKNISRFKLPAKVKHTVTYCNGIFKCCVNFFHALCWEWHHIAEKENNLKVPWLNLVVNLMLLYSPTQIMLPDFTCPLLSSACGGFLCHTGKVWEVHLLLKCIVFFF